MPIRELNLPQSIGFTAAVLAAALQTIAVPFVGSWVDKVGQTRVMISAAILFMVTAYRPSYCSAPRLRLAF